MREHSRLVEHRNSYFGSFTVTPLMSKTEYKNILSELELPEGRTFTLPPPLREGKFISLLHFLLLAYRLPQYFFTVISLNLN